MSLLWTNGIGYPRRPSASSGLLRRPWLDTGTPGHTRANSSVSHFSFLCLRSVPDHTTVGRAYKTSTFKLLFYYVCTIRLMGRFHYVCIMEYILTHTHITWFIAPHFLFTASQSTNARVVVLQYQYLVN